MKYPAELFAKLADHVIARQLYEVEETLGELADFVGAELCRHDVQAIGLENLDGPVVLGPSAAVYRELCTSGIEGIMGRFQGEPIPEPFRGIYESTYTTGRIVGAYERELERQEDLRCDPKGI